MTVIRSLSTLQSLSLLITLVSELIFDIVDAHGDNRTPVAIYRQDDANLPANKDFPNLIGCILVIAGVKFVSNVCFSPLSYRH